MTVLILAGVSFVLMVCVAPLPGLIPLVPFAVFGVHTIGRDVWLRVVFHRELKALISSPG